MKNKERIGKHNKGGIKTEHTVLEGILPILKMIIDVEGVKRIIPAKISKTKGATEKSFIKLQRETRTGFKLAGHNGNSVQEVFIICNPKFDINKLKGIITIN